MLFNKKLADKIAWLQFRIGLSRLGRRSLRHAAYTPCANISAAFGKVIIAL
jgi:hypothetical protein